MSKTALFAVAMLVAIASIAITVLFLPTINHFLDSYRGVLW